MARVDSVLVDPSTGRVTYFILSFVDGNERMALPFRSLSIDTRGRARLVSKKGALAQALPLGRPPSPPSVSYPAGGPYPLEGDSLPIAGFKAEGNGAAILQGRVTGRMTLPDGAGRRRVQLVVLAGTESVRVDLGAEENLRQIGLELRPGDNVQIEARKAGEGELAASVVRFAGASFRIAPP